MRLSCSDFVDGWMGSHSTGSMDADQFDAQLRHAPAPTTRAANTELPAMARPTASGSRMTGPGRVLATGAAVVSTTTSDGATTVDYKRKSKMANQPVCLCLSHHSSFVDPLYEFLQKLVCHSVHVVRVRNTRIVAHQQQLIHLQHQQWMMSMNNGNKIGPVVKHSHVFVC
jgi:hypothetical protein